MKYDSYTMTRREMSSGFAIDKFSFLFWVLFSGCFVVDFFTKIEKFLGSESYLSLFFRLTLFLIIFIAFKGLRISSLLTSGAIISLAFLVILNMDLGGQFFERDIYFLLKIAVATISVILFLDILKKYNPIRIEKFFRRIVYIFSFNSILVVLGLFFDVSFFEMDKSEHRDGFTGILPFSGNEVNYFYLITIFYISVILKSERSFGARKKAILVYISYIIMAILSGLKGSIFFAAVSLFYVFPRFSFVILFLLVLILEGIVGFLSSSSLYLVYKFHDLNLLNFLTGNRLVRLQDNWSDDWGIWNVYFGQGSLTNFEMDFFTLLYSYGFVGFLYFSIWVFYAFYLGLKDRRVFVLWSACLGFSLVAGHLVSSIFIIPWLVFTSVSIRGISR